MRNLSRIYPKSIRESYKTLMRYCDIEGDHERYVGKVVLTGLVLAFIVSVLFDLFIFPMLLAAFVFVVVFVIIEIIGYLSLILRADAKGRVVESVLPDALLLMSMNIKSGITTDHALIVSARPEFGPLERELNRAGKLIVAGKEVRHALLNMTTRIRSELFDRTIRLILEGIESGGELSSLLHQTAEDIQNTRLVRNEVKSNLMMYGIFIFFAVGIGAPLLFGISTYLVGSIGTQFSTFQTGGSDQMVFGGLQISPDFMLMFAVIALVVTSFFGGLIIGIIKSGSEKAGIKLIPLLLIISLFVFFSVRIAVASVFPAFT